MKPASPKQPRSQRPKPPRFVLRRPQPFSDDEVALIEALGLRIEGRHLGSLLVSGAQSLEFVKSRVAELPFPLSVQPEVFYKMC